MQEYFGWPIDWAESELGPASSVPSGTKYKLHTREDRHLRSAGDLAGYAVWSTDGEIGSVDDFVMDDATWHLGYLIVKTGDWLYNRSVLVPTHWVDSVSWANRRLNLDHARAAIPALSHTIAVAP
jgi:sporulation protein YlmC with PRC-barrel domain